MEKRQRVLEITSRCSDHKDVCDPPSRWETHMQTRPHTQPGHTVHLLCGLPCSPWQKRYLQCVPCAWKATSCGAAGPTQSCAGHQNQRPASYKQRQATVLTSPQVPLSRVSRWKGLRPHTTLRTTVRVIEYKVILETVIDSLLFCSEDFSLFLKCISLSKKQSLEGHPTFHLSGIYYLTLCCCWWMKLKNTAENSNMAESRGPNSSFGSTRVLRSTKRKENPLLPTSPHPSPAPVGAGSHTYSPFSFHSRQLTHPVWPWGTRREPIRSSPRELNVKK